MQIPADIRRDVTSAKTYRRKAAAAQDEASKRTEEILKRILAMPVAERPSNPEIARWLGISRQRVGQLIERIENKELTAV